MQNSQKLQSFCGHPPKKEVYLKQNNHTTEATMNAAVLTKTFIYVAILLIGYTFKKLGIFHRSDSKFLNSVILNLTMPAAIINGFQGVSITPHLLAGLGIGLFANTFLLVAGQVMTMRRTPNEQTIFVFSTNCFAIATFSMPFLNGLVSADGFAAICMFDISVALMCYGVNIAVGNARMGGDGRVRFVPLVKKIFSSPVFLTYMVLIILSMCNVHLPQALLDLSGTIGSGNGFLAMLSIGILFELRMPQNGRGIIVRLLVLRYSLCLAMSMAVYFLLPLPQDIRLALSVLLMAPCASSAPLLTESAGADGSVAAAINSLSIPISITIMTLMLTFLH